MRNLLVLGPTGPTGILLIQKALASEFRVTGYARTPSKLESSGVSSSNINLRVVEGTLGNWEALSSAIEGQNVIISFLGPDSASPWSHEPKYYTAFYRNTLFPLMRQHDVCRVFINATVSFFDPRDQRSWIRYWFATFIWATIHTVWDDFETLSNAVLGSEGEGEDLEWTLMRLGFLNDKEDSGQIFAGYVDERGFNSRSACRDRSWRGGIWSSWNGRPAGQEPRWLRQRVALSSFAF